MPTVAVTDYTFPNLELERSILSAGGFDLFSGNDKQVPALQALVAEADAVITQFAPINAEVIGAMQRAKVIVRYGIGYDNVDVKAARERGIPVCNIPTTASMKSPITRWRSYSESRGRSCPTRCTFETANGGWRRRSISCGRCAIRRSDWSASVALVARSRRGWGRSSADGSCMTALFRLTPCVPPDANRSRSTSCWLSPTS